jgi:hypothetical protein
MDKLPCDMVISFYRDGKFLWETDLNEGGKGQSVNSLITACNKVCDTFGGDVDWEIGIVSLVTGHGIKNLHDGVKKLSAKIATAVEISP